MRRTTTGAAVLIGMALAASGPNDANAQSCMVTTPVGPGRDVGTAVAIQPDGQILLAGYASNGINDDFAVVRYNHDFTLDTSFGTGGIVMTPIGGAQDRAEAMVVQPDGKILLAGHTDVGGGNHDFAVVRYNIDGTLDTSFNAGGLGGPPNTPGMMVTSLTGNQDEIEAIALQSDGKIVAAGFAGFTVPGTKNYAVARYNANGTLDTTGFNAPTGFVVSTIPTDDTANAVAIQPSDGKIVLAGWANSGVNDDFVVVRFDTNGIQDGGFGNVLINFPPNDIDRAHAVIVRPSDGKIVVAGEARTGGFGAFGAARLNPDGSIDGTFGTGGTVITSFTGGHDIPFSMVEQTDEKLVLGGYTNWFGAGASADMGVLRYHANGTPDNAFDTDGRVTTDFAADNDWIDSVALQPDGKILAGGYSDTGPADDFALVRYLTDGSVDPSCIATISRSIGTAAARTSPGDGTVTAVTGSKVVTGSGTLWRTWNRGRGDVITIDSGDYAVAGVLSDTELRLTTPYAGTSGSGLAYTIDRQFDTLSDWEDCIDGPGGTPCTYFPVASNNLITDNRTEVGIAYRDSVFTAPLTIDLGAPLTTDATHNITLTVDPGNRHQGVAGSPGSHVILDPSSDGHGIRVVTDYTSVEWFEITGWTGVGNEGVRIEADQTSYSHMIVHDPGAANPNADGFHFKDDGDWTATIRNTIIYGIDRSCIYLLQDNTAWNMVLNVENVTASGCGFNSVNPEEAAGVSVCAHSPGTATLNATNVLSVDNPPGNDFNIVRNVDCDIDGSWGTSNFNVDSDGTAPGASTFTSNAATEFVSTASSSEDLHLKSGAVAINKGTDLSPAITNDIDAETRPQGGIWDIGADEGVASGVCPTGNRPWYDDNWQYRKAITINSTMVASPLSNFPVLVRRNTENDLRDFAQNDGDDILFTAADGITKLPHELELFNGTNGAVVAWVKVPYVSSGADAIIYLYYGNGGATNQEDAPNVWDAGFRAVWHLSEDPSISQLFDSTANANHGTAAGGMNSGNQVPGQVAGSLDFDGVDDLVNAGNGEDGLGPMTASAWVRPDTVSGTAGKVLAKYDSSAPAGRWYLELDDSAPEDNAWEFAKGYVTDDLQVASVDATATFNEWQYVALTWDGSASAGNVHLYKNGAELGYQVTTSGVGAKEPDTGAPLLIGNRSDTLQGFDGRIDEVRVSNIVRSADWLATEFNNQDDPLNFCQFCAQTTEVRLESFGAEGVDAAVELTWKTASELKNLGFHLYRATSEVGPYHRITEKLIPGLGSSPSGATYTYRDAALVNGVTYYYELEDVETTGRTERHGPVSATPLKGAAPNVGTGGGDHEPAQLTYGEPGSSGFRIVPRNNGVMLELDTGGFVAVPQDDGSVRLEVPGLEEMAGSSFPVKRAWVEAVAGRNVTIKSVRTTNVERFDGLRPSSMLEAELAASVNGTVRARLRRRGQRQTRREAAKLVDVAYQGESKKALVELSPFTWDRSGLVLAKRLEVHLVFHGREAIQRRTRRSKARTAVRLVAVERGLYQVLLEELVGRRRVRRTNAARLSRGGEDVAYHLEGGVLYFWSEGAAENPYGHEAVYELELGVAGETMPVSAPTASDVVYWHTLEREENRYYQAGLVDAPDVWLWEALFAPERKSFTFDITELAGESAELAVWLQGTSDFPTVDDHHVRVHVNGVFAAEARWDGKNALRVGADIVVHEGENILELENVGDTGATYSMVMLDRFRLRYPRQVSVLENARYVLDVTDTTPRWVTSRSGFDAGRSYLATDTPLRPEIRKAPSTKLRKPRRADYLVIGPKGLLDAAKPLLEHRKRQGLRVATASTEAIASEFGHGELTPDAIRELIAYAYHEWKPPKLRYVLLLGDATYDFKDYMGTGVVNQLPPYMVRTTYLWTASDPAYAAVNGDDLLPDVAIGRLPAKSVAELAAMVSKLLAYESGELALDAPFVLVADNADRAGDFEADANEIATTLLAGRDTKRIYVSELGAAGTRDAIVDSFDAGASTVSYLGHGGIHLWADENVFNKSNVDLLSPQAQQPLLLTMNCLNGYFHFPYFDSLAEALLKQETKGVIAAFSPSGLSLNAPAHRYHKALLEELLSGRHQRLGDAVLAAQKRYADTGAFPELLSIYHLFGDPAITVR